MWDPLYEVYIQTLEPKEVFDTPYRYRTVEYLDRKRAFVKNKRGGHHRAIEDTDSSSEDDDDPHKFIDNEVYWDADELERMQLDEFTSRRQYIKVTCQKTSNKQD